MRILLAILLAGCVHHDAGDDVSCTGPNPTFPTFDKTCERADFCIVAFHTINCCGTQVAIGISDVERDRFMADEARCEAQLPECDCAKAPTQAENGHTASDDSQIIVDCTPDRQCMTAAP